MRAAFSLRRCLVAFGLFHMGMSRALVNQSKEWYQCIPNYTLTKGLNIMARHNGSESSAPPRPLGKAGKDLWRVSIRITFLQMKQSGKF